MNSDVKSLSLAALACVALFANPLPAQVAVGKHKVLELVFTAAVNQPNPFDTYLLKLEVTDPAGKTFTLDGFYDGDGSGGQEGRTWKARLCPYVTGGWSWRTIPADASDRGLTGLAGQFTCVESGDQGGIVAQGRYFKLQDGDTFFPVGNFLDPVAGLPMWAYLGEETTDADRREIISRHRDVYAANKYYFYISNHSDLGSDVGRTSEYVTPWVGTRASSDKSRMDLERWKHYDIWIQQLKDDRMIAEAIIFEDGKRESYGFLPEVDKNRLLRYVMARTSTFSHMMYVICMEWPEAWKQDQVGAAGMFLQAHNPWKRPISVHLLNGKPWDFSGQSWPTFISSQLGNDDHADTVNQYVLSLRSEPIPNLADEFGILRSESDASLRAKMWASFCGGAAGVGTGSDQKAFQRFLAQSRIPFQRMSPGNHFVQDGGATRFCFAEDGHHYLVYSTSEPVRLKVSKGGLMGRWFNPRDPDASLGTAFPVVAARPGHPLKDAPTFTPPTDLSNDWVLWVSDGSHLGDGVNHPSPGASVTRVEVERQP